MSTNGPRTLVVGDIHGKLELFVRLLEEMEYRSGRDRLVLIGDLIDRGEDSKGVVDLALALKRESPETVVVLQGNHEQMLVRAVGDLAEGEEPDEMEMELWFRNGGQETLDSYRDGDGNLMIPDDHWEFLSTLPTWHEDEQAIYVHASLVEDESGEFLHPAETPDDPSLLWSRNRNFFAEYRGKTVVFGHTITGMIFGETGKVWVRENVIGVDTGAYLYGVLSAIELPSRRVFSVSEAPRRDATGWWLRSML